MKRQEAIDRIVIERARQERLKREGKFMHTNADNIADVYRLSVTLEELGEVARAINDGDPENLKDEVTEVAACCLAWLEAL